MKHKILTSLMSASLEELLAREFAEANTLESLYQLILKSYLSGDITALQNLEELVTTDSPKSAHHRALKDAFLLRLMIRTRDISQASLMAIVGRADQHSSNLWRGEIHFLLGLAFEQLEKNCEAKDQYTQAAQFFSTELPTKALKAKLNAVVAESRINPENRLLNEYQQIAKEAAHMGAQGIAGVAFLNLSREYAKLCTLELALEYSNLALSQLEKDEGCLHHHLALVHHSELLLKTQRRREAFVFYQRAVVSPFCEVQAACKVIEGIISDENPKTDAHLTPTWRERWLVYLDKGGDEEQKLSASEQHLVEVLLQGPKNKFELIDELYKDAGGTDFFVLENRLKVLLSRFRRKKPGTIRSNKSRFEIAPRELGRRL